MSELHWPTGLRLSSAGPSRTTSSGAVRELRPIASAATNEYGQPGMNWEALLARP